MQKFLNVSAGSTVGQRTAFPGAADANFPRGTQCGGGSTVPDPRNTLRLRRIRKDSIRSSRKTCARFWFRSSTLRKWTVRRDGAEHSDRKRAPEASRKPPKKALETGRTRVSLGSFSMRSSKRCR